MIRACILSRAHVVEALLDRGANINYANRFGKTALHYTAAAGMMMVVMMVMVVLMAWIDNDNTYGDNDNNYDDDV